MKTLISLKFEDYVLNEIQILCDTLESCLGDIEDAEFSSDDDVKILSISENVLDSDDIKSQMRDVIDMLSKLKDLL